MNEQKQLRSVILLQMQMNIQAVMYKKENRGRRKFVILDEAWDLLSQGGNTAAFFETGARDVYKRQIKTVIEQKFPGMKVLRVSKTEIPGWLLVESDSDRVENYMYVHESGRYVLSGALFDIQMLSLIHI